MIDESEELRNATAARELLRTFNDTEWRAGSSEPWVRDLLASLLVANNTRVAVEVGGFEGYTSAALKRALHRVPHVATLTVCEIDPTRASAVDAALQAVVAPSVQARVVIADSHDWLPTLAPNSVDFAWLDGNHELAHVAREVELLWPAMAPGGLICGHDVHGVCELWRVFAPSGIALDLPRLGPAGGVGIIQKPR